MTPDDLVILVNALVEAARHASNRVALVEGKVRILGFMGLQADLDHLERIVGEIRRVTR